LFSASFEWLDLVLHFIVANDFEEIFLILISIEESESDSGIAKSANSSNTMHVAFIVWEMILWRNVKIDNELNGMHVKTTREQICCYNNIDRAFSEFLNAFISFFFSHITKHNEASVFFFIKSVVYLFCKIFRVNENDCLSVVIERIKNLHDVINLSAFLALMIELLNIF